MPFVRISIPAGKGDAFTRAVADAVHDAMVATIDVPPADRFQAITEHRPGWLILDPDYLGVSRSGDAMIVQISLLRGRTPEKKRALYRAIAQNLGERAGVRREDVLVTLTENEHIDWSFGDGEAQIA